MKKLFRTLARKWSSFRHLEHGAAAVEFALILPVMLVLYIGAVEGSALISTDRRVQMVSGSLGDLVARANKSLPAATLTDYFKAASGIMTPYSATGLKQVVTQVYIKPDGTNEVVWSKQYINGVYGPGTEYAAKSVYPDVPDSIKTIAKGNYVIVAKAQLSYTPISNFVYKAAIPLGRVNYFMPRFGEAITIE